MNVREAGSGEAVLLVHGFPFSSAMWAGQLERPPAGWHLLAPDLPGFGASPAPVEERAAYSMEGMATSLIELLDRRGIDRAVVCGLSMGGYVALALLRLHRARVRGLVLADTRAGADGAAGRRARAEAAARARVVGSVQGEVAAMLPRLLSERSLTGRPEVVTALRTMMEATPVETFASVQAGMAERPDSTTLLPEIEVPTVVVVGAEDHLTPPAEAEAMAAAIPGASLRVIDGAAHVTPLEAAEAFNAVLAAFLLRLRPRRPPGR